MFLTIREMQSKTTMKYNVRMVVIKKKGTDNKCW